jgi:[acyl-carrier-protein] S-malonyltransferase
MAPRESQPGGSDEPRPTEPQPVKLRVVLRTMQACRIMAKKIALLFSGQGAQEVGMGKTLSQRFAAAANLFSQADELLGRSLSQIAFEGPMDELTKTSNCQLALYVHGLALLQILREELGDFRFAACAGLSLGELTAHVAGGTFNFATGTKLVAARSTYMEEACESTHGAMAAFVGGEESDVRSIAREADVDIANLNSPGQIVLSGERERIERAITLAKVHGIKRAFPLNVAGAFHSRLMASAEAKLREDLAQADIGHPSVTIVANVTAQPVTDPTAVRQTLAQQVTGSVRWAESIEYLIDHEHCELFLELGLGEVLAGLVGRIRKGTQVLSIGDPESLEDALPAIRAGLR